MTKSKPIIRWPGGKTRHLKSILPLIPEHQTYVEPFAGGLAVLLAKPPSKFEIVNDINRDLVSLYRCVRFHPDALAAEFNMLLCSRAEWQDAAAQPGLTDIQRAARWFIRNAQSWGGMSGTYAMGKVTPFHRRQSAIHALHSRMATVNIECRDSLEILRCYDKRDTFFFIDPPYQDADVKVYDGYNLDQIRLLCNAVESLKKSSWMITINDSPETRDIFSAHKIRSIQTRNNLDTKSIMREIIIQPS